MAKGIRKKQDNILDELEDSINTSKPKVKVEIESSVEDIKSSKDSDDTILIKPELEKLEKNIKEIDIVLDSINPLAITDIEERAKVLKLKMEIMFKQIPLLAALDNLRTKDKLKTEQIKGNKDISPLEDGSLD